MAIDVEHVPTQARARRGRALGSRDQARRAPDGVAGRARRSTIPVVGMGGIMNAEDAVEFLLAGATAVAVGTANFVDPTATMRVVDGLEHFCRSRGIALVSELIGGLEA